MTVRAIYENGVFRPHSPISLDDRTEVEIEVKAAAPPLVGDEADPRAFVGFIKSAPQGVPLARDHDDYLDK